MKIVLFWYNTYQKNFFWENKDFIFFDNNGWWIYKNGKRKNFKINHFVENKISNTKFDFLKIIKKIKSSSSIWIRHNTRGDTYEKIVRKASINTFYIFETLNYLSSKKKNIAIFNTGVSHHLDTEICDLASTLAGWEKYYFYIDIFAGRLVPLKVADNVSKREIVNNKFANFRYEGAVNEFIENLNNNKKPKINDNYDIYNKVIFFSIFKIIFYKIKNLLIFLLKILVRKKQKNIFDFAYSKFPFQDFIQIYEQRKAINFYLKNLENINFQTKDAPIIILASFQPEATTTPEGFNYENFIELVFNIRKLGFQGTIYFKEHDGTFLYTWFNSVTQVSNSRSIDFYKQLKILGCKFIDQVEYDKIKLNKKFKYMVVIINGTVAIERSLTGYHTIVAGSPYYKKMPGVINFSEIKKLKSLSYLMLKKNKKLIIESKKFFLKKLNNNTLINLSNIGTGKKNSVIDYNLIKDYKIEFVNFIKNLKIIK